MSEKVKKFKQGTRVEYTKKGIVSIPANKENDVVTVSWDNDRGVDLFGNDKGLPIEDLSEEKSTKKGIFSRSKGGKKSRRKTNRKKRKTNRRRTSKK